MQAVPVVHTADYTACAEMNWRVSFHAMCRQRDQAPDTFSAVQQAGFLLVMLAASMPPCLTRNVNATVGSLAQLAWEVFARLMLATPEQRERFFESIDALPSVERPSEFERRQIGVITADHQFSDLPLCV